MDAHQHAALLRLFGERRLDPTVPEHNLFIRGQLAMLELTNPGDAANFKAFYDEKLATSLAKQAAEAPQAPAELVTSHIPSALPIQGELTMADLQKVLDDKAAKAETPVEQPVPIEKPKHKKKTSTPH